MVEGVNWELENIRNFLREKGFKFQYELGCPSLTAYVYMKNGSRLEVWDNKKEIIVTGANRRRIDLSKL